jgi:hypothetical protein
MGVSSGKGTMPFLEDGGGDNTPTTFFKGGASSTEMNGIMEEVFWIVCISI